MLNNLCTTTYQKNRAEYRQYLERIFALEKAGLADVMMSLKLAGSWPRLKCRDVFRLADGYIGYAL